MEVLHPRCCGLDVHKDTVVACVRLVIDGKTVKEVRTFSTTTADLMALSQWLAENKCTHIAMESTGVYWKPVWHILADGEFELVLANAAHIKGVPGRKSDVKDADWVSDLLAHGLIRASFVPDSPTQEMRTFIRTRKQLSREQARHILRIQKTLEDANIKLDSVISDLMGVSGRKIIEALIAGQRDPAKLARLADPRVKASQETLRQALRGRVTRQHRFLLRLHLDQIDGLDAAIAKIDREVEAAIAPFRTAVEQVSSVPGVKNLAALQIISEIGTDMSRTHGGETLRRQAMKLNGWRRLGVLASVSWLIGMWIHIGNLQEQKYRDDYRYVYRACRERPHALARDFVQSKECRAVAREYAELPVASWLSQQIAFVVLPIPLWWLLAHVCIWLARWVKRGVALPPAT